MSPNAPASLSSDGLPLRARIASRLRGHLPLCALTISGAFLRFFQLGRNSLWLDEGSSVAIAQSGWHTLANVVWIGEANMALYFFLLHLWLRLGNSEFIIRALSVVFAVATLPLLYALGAHLFNRRVGLVATLLLAVNAAHIEYAQEARSYSLVIFLVTLSSFLFVVGLQRPCLKNWCAYVLGSVLAAYAHLFGILVLPAQWSALLFMRPTVKAWRQLTAAALAITLLLLPLGLFAVTRDSGQLDWVPASSIDSVIGLFYLLAGTLDWAKSLLAIYVAGVLMALAALMIGDPADRARYGFLVATAFVPIVLALVISLFKPVFVDRYLLICLPFFTLLAAAGVCRIESNRLLTALIVVTVGFALRSDYQYYFYIDKEDWRDATQYVVSRARPDDAVVLYADEVRWPFDYYEERENSRHAPPVVVSPRWDSCFRVGAVYAGGRDSAGPSMGVLKSLPSKHRRVWLVLSHDQIRKLGRDKESRFLRTSFAGEYPSVTERDFPGITVLLYARPVRPAGIARVLSLRQPHAHRRLLAAPGHGRATKPRGHLRRT